MKKLRKVKKRYIVLIAVLIVLIAVVIVFAQFTSLGYRMTVPLRGFIEAAPNVYISRNFTDDVAEAATIVGDAKQRVLEFLGETRSIPTVIICDDVNTIKKLGGDHDTMTTAIVNVYSYIVISAEYLNVDVVAHEMTHAEVHRRILNGKLGFQLLIPTWFDEGLALQNDYRDMYDENAWEEATDYGKSMVVLSEMDTPAKFYAGNLEERRYRYVVSKHELTGWIDRNGVDALIDLLDRVNQGEAFNDLYFAN